jgi:transposase-like protein
MNDTQTEPQKRKKRYDLNFKRSAVELWRAGGKSAAAVAAELGISGQTLKTLKQQLAVPPPPSTGQGHRKRAVSSAELGVRSAPQFDFRHRQASCAEPRVPLPLRNAEIRPLHLNVSQRFWCIIQNYAHEKCRSCKTARLVKRPAMAFASLAGK